jgi:hypothetical protein
MIELDVNIEIEPEITVNVEIEGYGTPYVLPIGSASVLGGFKVGANLTVDPVTGILSAGNSYVLPIGSTTVLGGFKVGDRLTVDPITGIISADVQTVDISGKADKIHNLIDTTNHPVTGLTAGHFLKALSATTYGFAAHGLTYSDVGAAASGHNHSGTYLPVYGAGDIYTHNASEFAASVHTHSYLPLGGGTLTGNLLFSADNTLDIGASDATRPRTGYFGTSVRSPLFEGGGLQTQYVTLQGNIATASGSNIAGGDVYIKATPGTGTGTSAIHFYTGTTLGAGNTLQSSSEKMILSGNGILDFTNGGYPRLANNIFYSGLLTNGNPLSIIGISSTNYTKITGNAGIIMYINNTDYTRMDNFGRWAFGSITTASAYLTLPAGTATAGTSATKWTPVGSVLLTAPEIGAWEPVADAIYYTIPTNTTRTNVLLNNVGFTGGQTLVGGTAVGDYLTYKSTTGAGTVSGIAHQWTGGTNGATVIATMLNNGTVGIGTTGPAQTLDVVGSIHSTLGITSDYYFQTSSYKMDSNGLCYVSSLRGNYSMGTLTAGGAYPLTLNAGNATYTGGYLTFNTDANERMRILNNGNVGIGTTAPGAKLDVSDSTNSTPLILRDGYNPIGFGWVPYTSAGSSTYTMAIGANGGIPGISYYGNNFDLRGYNNTSHIAIRAGNVGIGTTSPTARLHLPAGTATQYTAPTKWTPTNAVLLLTPEEGAWEPVNDDISYTIKTGTARKQIVMTDGTLLTSGRIPVASTNGRLINSADLSGSGNRIVQASAAGALGIAGGVVAGKLVDATAIALLIDNANWTLGIYTGTAISGTYEGMYYKDDTYYYTAYADNDWLRIPRA